MGKIFIKRDKACYTPNCKANKAKTKFPDDMNYCPYCAQPLDYVCINHGCFNQVDGPNELCQKCEAEKEEAKENRNENMKKAGKFGLAAVAVVAVPFKDAIIEGGKVAFKAIVKK